MEDMLYEAVSREAPLIQLSSQSPIGFEDFQHELYDWNDPAFKKTNKGKTAYLPVLLTRGYFMMVSPQDHWRMTHFPDGSIKKWHLKKDIDELGNIIGLYAKRRGRSGEPCSVYAHRELLGILHGKTEGDHINGFGLDNRRINLKVASEIENKQNRTRIRKAHPELRTGVEYRGRNRKGQQLFGGIRAVRLRKNKVKCIRTKRTWTSQEKPAQWYLNQLKKIHKRATWSHHSPSVNYPVFPPLMESEPVLKPRRETKEMGSSIPF